MPPERSTACSGTSLPPPDRRAPTRIPQPTRAGHRAPSGPGERGADGGPVVVAQKQIGVHALVAAAPAILHDVFQVNASDARPVDLDPLFREPRVVDVADVEMDPHRGTLHVVQELPELARADE